MHSQQISINSHVWIFALRATQNFRQQRFTQMHNITIARNYEWRINARGKSNNPSSYEIPHKNYRTRILRHCRSVCEGEAHDEAHELGTRKIVSEK